MKDAPTPYRLIVFGRRLRHVRTLKGRGPHRKGAQSVLEPVDFSFHAWNDSDEARQLYDLGRLPGAGTFCWPGLHAVRAEAMRQVSQSGIHQISVRTNQDRRVYRYFKQPDGRIAGYMENQRAA